MADVLGAFEQAVLLSLVKPVTARGKEAYGRAILAEVQHRLGRDVAAGAVYATLDRLEEKGLISSHLEEGGGPRARRPRRCFEVEADGIRALNEAKVATERLHSGVRWPIRVG
jgi:PadR family transcriptional regulator, regulatory protein PadR